MRGRSRRPLRSLLVVDDNSLDIRIARRMISESRFRIDEAHTLVDALVLISNKHYDVILCDLVMPGVKPGESFDRILDAVGPDTIVIPWSGMEGVVENTVDKGDPEGLASAINMALESLTPPWWRVVLERLGAPVAAAMLLFVLWLSERLGLLEELTALLSW